MRTRRSPRNQDRLFRYLSGPAPSTDQVRLPIRSDAEIDAMFWLSKATKEHMKRAAATARAALAQQ